MGLAEFVMEILVRMEGRIAIVEPSRATFDLNHQDLAEVWDYTEIDDLDSIILNCQDYPIIQSSGIGRMAQMKKRLSRRGRKLAVTGLTDETFLMLKQFKLADALNIYESMEQALESVNEGA